jgi:hypothetical protein
MQNVEPVVVCILVLLLLLLLLIYICIILNSELFRSPDL